MLPTLFALQMPEIFLVLGLSGLVGAFYAAARRDPPARQRAIFLCVAMAAAFPIALTVALRPAMYNGIRHFVFVLPPLAVLGGLRGRLAVRMVAPAIPLRRGGGCHRCSALA